MQAAGCSKPQGSSETLESAAPYQVSSSQLFAAVQRLSPADKAAVFAKIGSMTFKQYYDTLAAWATDRTIVVDGQVFKQSKKSLAGLHDELLQLGQRFPTLAAMWVQIGFNPNTLQAKDLADAVKVMGAGASMPNGAQGAGDTALALGTFWPSPEAFTPVHDDTCDPLHKKYTAIFGITVNQIADNMVFPAFPNDPPHMDAVKIYSPNDLGQYVFFNGVHQPKYDYLTQCFKPKGVATE